MDELKETKRQVIAYEVCAKCSKCGGELIEGDNVLLTEPPQFQYTCSKCGELFYATKSYPFIKFEPMDSIAEKTNTSAVKLSIDLPDNPTCGNVFESIFDVSEVEEHNYCIFMKLDQTCDARFTREWWHSPFIRKGENNGTEV